MSNEAANHSTEMEREKLTFELEFIGRDAVDSSKIKVALRRTNSQIGSGKVVSETLMKLENREEEEKKLISNVVTIDRHVLVSRSCKLKKCIVKIR